MAKIKELFNEEDIKTQAQLNLMPILMQEVVLAGQEAFKLVGVEDTYVPYKIQDSIRSMIDKFADSMLSTDKDKLAKIINDGIEEGSSITEIRDKIESDFGDYTKVQAERITRTEVLRASSMAAEDAFVQSGVVEGKQWLVAPDACPICAPYSGKIVKLGADFYDPDESGFQNGNPPLHVNCRCQLIPIVTGAASYKPNLSKTVKDQSEYIQELEAQLDKRTKSAKEVMASRADDAIYIKALESHLGVSDD